MLRTQVVDMLVTFEDENVLKEARRRFQTHVAGTHTVPADIRKAVYVAAVMDAHHQPSSWDSLFKLYEGTDLNEERLRIALALGHARSKDLLLKVSYQYNIIT